MGEREPEVARTLHALFLRDEDGADTDLRVEDRQKVVEVASLLEEVSRAAGRGRNKTPAVLVDAAAGKAPLGLIAAELVLSRLPRPWRVVVLERDPGRVAACQRAAGRLEAGAGIEVEVRRGDVGEAALWPEAPELVVALHACGLASDRIIERAIGARARRLLLVPCCYGAAPGAAGPAAEIPGQLLAVRLAEAQGVPRQALVGRRFAQSLIDSQRTLRLEAAGYQTEVVELVAPTVTPFNLLWRSRRVLEPARMREASERLARLCG